MTVDVVIPIEDAAARQLQADPLKRAALGRLISEWMSAGDHGERLIGAMRQMSAEAAARGLTDDILEAELAAYNAERRG